MPNKSVLVLSWILALAVVAEANAQAGDSTFPLLAGKNAPLTLRLKDLDSNWRVFSASSESSYASLIQSAMMGGSSANNVYTKGETVTVGTEVFLITYKPEPPDMASLFARGGSGGPPKPKPLTESSVLRLSLLNLHALGAMDGIHVFDLKEEIGVGQKASLMDIIQKQSTTVPASTAEPAEPSLLKAGTKAPDFVVHDDNGRAMKLSSYKGKVVVLDFWATWCGPCQDSLPKTNAVARKYAAKNVVFLGVNVWDNKKAFHDWLPTHKSLSSIKFGIDTHGQGQDVATKLYKVSGIPTQYVVDARGRIVKSLVGNSDDESGLTSGINLALRHH